MAWELRCQPFLSWAKLLEENPAPLAWLHSGSKAYAKIFGGRFNQPPGPGATVGG